MTVTSQIELDHEHCRDITEEHGPNFSLGFRLLPPLKRRAVRAAYAFCRLADDIADEHPCRHLGSASREHGAVSRENGSASREHGAVSREGAASREYGAAGREHGTAGREHGTAGMSGAHPGLDPDRALREWEQELDRVYAGRPVHPVGRALANSLRSFDIPRQAFADLMEGCRHDLEGRLYQTYEQLLAYCELVAATIGRISLSIFGVLDPRAREHGHDLAIALQLTNILRDVREDALRGRVYLPASELTEFGVRGADLASGAGGRGFRHLMEKTIDRAAALYRRSEAVVTMIEQDSRLATQLMGGVYAEILRRIARDPERVLRERVGLTAAEKIELVERHRRGDPSSWDALR